ncbi:hypothetical protein HOC13_04345 [Candidatus Woesearchaeota archaeon]|jgi:NOL1/NOP2/fmu family ribosome biogenesis protein|nr:hypothetical protein [Candidatus Woesearchaeota archaeon]
MQQLKILNTREIKKIRVELVSSFGSFLEEDYAYLKNEKGRVFIVNKEISRIDLDKLRMDRAGVYFLEITRSGDMRVSMEGAWMIGKKAKKNVVVLNDKETKQYFMGEELDKDLGEEKKWVLLKVKKDVIGCAKYKEGRILNFMPKIHRSKDIMF